MAVATVVAAVLDQKLSAAQAQGVIVISCDPSGELVAGSLKQFNHVWDPIGLAWVAMTQPEGGEGGGGGTVTQGPAGASPWLVTGSVSISGTPVVTGPLTDAQLRASAVPISAASLPLPAGASTETTLAAIKARTDNIDVALSTRTKPADTQTISGSVSITGTPSITFASPQAVTGPLTDGQLRATAVPVSGTFWQGTQPVSGPLTDAQLRATAVPVSGSLADGGAGKTLKTASFSLSATGSVVAAVSTKRIKVYAYKIVCSAAISVSFRDGASNALEGAQPMAANGGATESVNPPAFLFASAAGNSLDLVISGSGTAAGRLSYWDDDTA